jgi:hypothetical protein
MTHDENCTAKCYDAPDAAHVTLASGQVAHYVPRLLSWQPVQAEAAR